MLDLFGLAISYPWLAALPAVGFAWMWASQHSRAALAAAMLWALYGLWEYSIWAGHSCEGECNIRIDLLIIFPVLLLMSLTAIVRTIRSAMRRRAVHHPHSRSDGR